MVVPKILWQMEKFSVSKFNEVWIQPAADAGGALGAALIIFRKKWFEASMVNSSGFKLYK